MSDITIRLRRWTHAVDAVPASDLMDEAADVIDSLRLTDAEREAIEWAADAYHGPKPYHIRDTIRGFLARCPTGSR